MSMYVCIKRYDLQNLYLNSNDCAAHTLPLSSYITKHTRIYNIIFIFSRFITLLASKLPCLRVIGATTSSDVVRVPHIPLVGTFGANV